uniref:Uncharacterized protein n=1 Tax=Myotis myotis TaxID=51298 RepID=A0A7J7U5L2_MYOMY|nr:hypothetical protein mMyoMyo1_008858 [Myotis myotis]
MGAPPQSICAASKCVVRSVCLGYLPTWKPLSHTCHPPSTSLTLDSRLCTSFSLEPQLSALQHQRRTLQAALWLGQGFSWLPPVVPRESHGDWSCSLRASQLPFTPLGLCALGSPQPWSHAPVSGQGFGSLSGLAQSSHSLTPLVSGKKMDL